MKKIISLILAVVVTAGMTSCKDSGGMKLPLFGFGSGESDNAASMKYMEYMYNNENGKSLNDQAMSGVTASDELTGKVNGYLKAPIIESLGQSNENSVSVNWWERMDISADNVAAFIESKEGQAKLRGYIEGMESGKSNSVGGIAVPGPRKVILEGLVVEMFGCFNDVSTIASGVTKLAEMFPVAVFFILAEMEKNNKLLDEIRDSIQTGFEQTNFRLDIIEQWLLSEDLRDVTLLVNSKMTDFTNLASIGMWQQRQNEMNEFFGPNSDYQYHIDRAFDSALQRAACLKSRSASADYKMIPGNMLYSDIIFMRKLSELRLASSSVFLNGRDLIRFRGVKAQEDLKKVKMLKEAFLSDTTEGRDPNYFSDVMSLLVSWEIVLRAHIEINTGRQIAEIDLEDAKHLSKTFGTFGDLDGNDATGTCGKALTSDAGQLIANLFSYGDSLESVFDAGTSGDLDSGKFIRMVHNGKNLLSDLHLVPVMKKLLTTSDMAFAPGKNEFFIDPALGRFILPRPNYWSKLESADDIANPEFMEELPNASAFGFPTDGKWGSCAHAYSTCSLPYTWYMNPFGNGCILDSGTLSFWTKMDTSLSAEGMSLSVHFGGDNSYMLLCGSSVRVVINGATAIQRNVSLANSGKWHHVYIAWDRNQTLSGNNYRIRIFIDGAELVTVPDDWTPGRFYLSFSTGASALVFYSIRFDNLKIWKNVVSENPDWEYNNGNGRENALHAVYGPDADPLYDYRPKLTGAGSGVGFYHWLP